MTVLEYTRAILKKTWPLAQTSRLTQEHRSQLDSLGTDVRYCAGRLAKLRDDPDMGFSERDKSALTEIVGCYDKAADCFAGYDAGAALVSTRETYRLLRKFIDDLHLQWIPPQSGQTVPQETPERVKLQEEPEVPEMEKERVESRLENLQQKIDSLAHQQESLKAGLENALQQTGQGQGASKSTDEASPSPSSGEGSSGQEPSGSNAKSKPAGGDTESKEGDHRQAPLDAATPSSGDPNGASQGGQQSDSSSAGRASQPEQSPSASQSADSASPSPGQGTEGKGTTGTGGNTPSEGTSPAKETDSARRGSTPGGSGGNASDRTDALLRMLQAKQQALRQQTSAVDAELKRLPLSEPSAQGKARTEAQGHLEEAIEQMKQFEGTLADLRYRASVSPEQKGAIADSADSMSRQLAEARQALERGLRGEQGTSDADKARELAEQLAQDAEAFDESVSPLEKADMLARLEAAKRLLESMAGTHWATVAGGGPGSAHVYTRSPTTTRAEEARLLAREFWSIALQARDHPIQPTENEASDIKLFEVENEFFESAARFRPPRKEQ
jgi:hypothetical protein